MKSGLLDLNNTSQMIGFNLHSLVNIGTYDNYNNYFPPIVSPKIIIVQKPFLSKCQGILGCEKDIFIDVNSKGILKITLCTFQSSCR